ncbi:glycoside hydrolase family 97 catalytic domain-containing protein [Pendulispora albinea]|uniref:Glycoside hydrolase family 97 protein n=1 Tax=Pendulispora albinea TaxID=2741071 RepID=A0ABZ2LSU1_9BACT
MKSLTVTGVTSLSFLLVGAIASCTGRPNQWTVSSPNDELTFDLRLGPALDGRDSGALTYTVHREHDGKSHDVLLPSPLGVRRDDQSFVDGLRFVHAGPATDAAGSYDLVHGKRRTIRQPARERVFTFANAAGARIELLVHVANDGVAFRYRFPEQDETPRKVLEEITGFHVPAGSSSWITPQQPPGRYTPAYEDLYVEQPAGTTAKTPSGWAFPALFHVGSEWLLVSESGMTDGNAGTRLEAEAPDGQYRIRLPEAGEGRGVGATTPESKLPWTLPWRVLVTGASTSTIVESTLIEDVAPPSTVADPSWIKAGRVSWSWWSDDDSPRNEAALKSFIDLSAEMGWEYSLIDANWNLMDPAALQRILAYARDKRIGIILWYNSGGPHNDVTEQPRDRMHLRDVRRAEFAKLQQWGVKGVKVDFWQSDKPDRMQQYLDLLRDAADFKLMVDFHGSTLPRGWERTYPQLMTMEGVPGAEQYKFNPEYPGKAAWHNTVLAFTRNAVGAMDYTPVTFTDHKYPRITTDGHELALSVVFESALQHFADSVAAYRALPAPAKDFLAAVPATWEETRLLGGEPGKLVVVARRGQDGWYIGGISGLDTPQRFELDLSFVKKPGAYTLTTVQDGDVPRKLASATRQVSSADKIGIDLLARGGFVATLRSRRD